MTSYSALFDNQAASYAEFRPVYPKQLYKELYEYCGDRPTDLALDIATGSGQAALEIAKRFSQVIAQDANENQLGHAPKSPNVEYQQATAEETGLPDSSVDLVTTSQALHWFDHPRFFKEVHRVLKPGGILAPWGYGLVSVQGNEKASQLIHDLRFGADWLGPYWNARRDLVDNNYSTITPDEVLFEDVQRKGMPSYSDCTIKHLMGYFTSWSAYATYRKQRADEPDILLQFRELLMNALGETDDSKTITVVWPIFMILARRRS